MSRPDVIVVGAGIVGATAAALLAEAGATTTLVEGSAIAAGASGRNSGVVQHPFDSTLRGVHLETVAMYRDLGRDPALAFAFPAKPAGLLLVALAEAGARRLASDLAARWPELEPEFIGPADLRGLEPAIGPDVSACRLGIGYPVPPAAATRAFAAVAERRGARILVGSPVAELLRTGDRTTGVRLADGTTLAAGAILVAAGPWSPALVDPSGRWRPIRPLWGVVVEVGLAEPPRHVLEEAEMDEALGEVGLASSADDRSSAATDYRPEFSLVTAAGRSSVGSAFLDDEPDPGAWVAPLIARGRRFIPALADAPVGTVRACVRPLAIDGRPLIGALPGRPGVFIAAGHGPWGISTGPGSARLVVDAILGRPVTIPVELRADRFGTPPG